ncbi:MAG: YkvA family protein [Ignavibacterium sp.]|nr:YkvA family protein [Ignavibacterium sp.]MDW8375871.1 YkvA family protein [Ignavibacteriales bacterium]
MSEYSNNYSDESFWDKVKNFAIIAGKELIEKALILFYCLQDPDTPAWAKGVIISALGYFIFPIDALPDPIFVDDLGVIATALATVVVHIKEEHKLKAKEQLARWFN